MLITREVEVDITIDERDVSEILQSASSETRRSIGLTDDSDWDALASAASAGNLREFVQAVFEMGWKQGVFLRTDRLLDRLAREMH